MKKILALLLALCLMLPLLVSCGIEDSGTTTTTAQGENAPADNYEGKAPKYVFLFIGDGMSYSQIQATASYLGAIEGQNIPKYMNFMNFESVGSAVNYTTDSIIPDSAASGTSIATGKKTNSGNLGVSPDGTEKYENIAEKLHSQLGMKVGIVTSVNLNHATPAAFYAHVNSRSEGTAISTQLFESGYEYFAGGGFFVSSKDDPNFDMNALAKKHGYKIVSTYAEAEALKKEDGKVVIFEENQADEFSLPYEIDRTEDMWALADYVKKGTELLDNEKGFFMMCESGKIDWASHANDAATIVNEVKALSDAVQVAIDFAEQHKGETLIIVTGDHETGGFSLGFAGTDSNTSFKLLSSQKMSYQKFSDEIIPTYKGKKIDVAAFADIEKYFGLTLEGDGELTLTNSEHKRIEEAYKSARMGSIPSSRTEEEKLMYGDYWPLAVTLTGIINNKAGLNFSSWDHTALPVAVYAQGLGSELFVGHYDNTNICNNLMKIMNVK